jgi:hypothetical protein
MVIMDQSKTMLQEGPLKNGHFRGNDLHEECSNGIRDLGLKEQGAAMTGKGGGDIQQDLQEDCRAGD